jgi:hypothetical protein
MGRDEDNLGNMLRTLSPAARDDLRCVLLRDNADRDAIAMRLMRYRDENGQVFGGPALSALAAYFGPAFRAAWKSRSRRSSPFVRLESGERPCLAWRVREVIGGVCGWGPLPRPGCRAEGGDQRRMNQRR